jgi:hypothetical protein
MTRTATRVLALTTVVALTTLTGAATAQARHGADDDLAPASSSVTVVDDNGADRVRADDGHRNRGRGGDDGRRGRGSDDGPGHHRERGSDDGPGHHRHGSDDGPHHQGRGSDDGPDHA